MATSTRKVLLVSIALAGIVQMAAASATTSKAEDGDSEQAAAPTAQTKRVQLKQSGLLPAFLWPARKTRQPNVFLMFFDLYEPMMPQQIKDMVDQQIRPQTEQMSEQILQSVPGAKQFYEQMNSFMQMFAQFGPQNFLGGGGGGGGRGNNALAELMGGFMGRR